MERKERKLPITIDPEIMSGIPVFAGTRVPVISLFDWLETESLETYLENFPSVSKQQAVLVLKEANQLIIDLILFQHENAA